MAKIKSEFQIKKEKIERKKAVRLYKLGHSSRTVAKLLRTQGITRSHMWVLRLVQNRSSITKKNLIKN